MMRRWINMEKLASCGVHFLDAPAEMIPAALNDPAIYPNETTLEKLYTTSPYGPKVQRTVTRMWTKIKSGT